MQQVSPITSFEAHTTAIIALNRTPIGIDGLVLLAEIDQLNWKGVRTDLEKLRRIVGKPKTKVWLRLHDIAPAGRQASAAAAQELVRAGGGDQFDHPRRSN